MDDDVMVTFRIGGYLFTKTTPGRLKEVEVMDIRDNVADDDVWSNYETPLKTIPMTPKMANQMVCQYKNPSYKPFYPE